MPETPKEKHNIDDKEPEPEKEDTWEEDQTEHEYYYDDAHGYEIFDVDEEGEETDD